MWIRNWSRDRRKQGRNKSSPHSRGRKVNNEGLQIAIVWLLVLKMLGVVKLEFPIVKTVPGMVGQNEITRWLLLSTRKLGLARYVHVF